MKSMLVIGMGRFGRHLARTLAEYGNEVMIVDTNEDQMTDLLPIVAGAQVGDCKRKEVLKSLGVSNYDICFVCISGSFETSLEVTSQLKDMGAKYVVAKSKRDLHTKFLLRNGADEVIYPERSMAERVGKRFSADHVFDYIDLTRDFSIAEIEPLEGWVGKSIGDLGLRNKHNIMVLVVKQGNDVMTMPTADYIFKKDDNVVVLGTTKLLDQMLKKL